MKTPRRSLLLVLPVVSLSLAACGGVPKGDVAVIKTESGGNLVVDKAQFGRFFNAALSQTEQKELSKLTPVVPPNFTACVAEKKAAIPKDSQRKTSDATLKKQCQTEYDTTRNTAMQQLVNLNWIKGELAARDITFRKAELKLALDNIITSTFQGQAGYQAFLKQSGLNQADVDLNVLATAGEKKIVAQLQAGVKTPTDAQVKRYFEQKRSQYVQPETRDLRLIKAKDLASANAALAAIKAGQSWKTIAAKYSTDTATKASGGSVVGTTADQQPPEFGANVFKAKAGALLGPIKTSLGYYVVKVQAVHAEKQPVYSELKAQLEQALESENQQNAIDNFRTVFLASWAARTKCASDYNQLVSCGGDAGGTQATTPKPGTPPGAGVPQYAPSTPVSAADAAAALQQQQAAGAQAQTAGG
ncbi:MAG: peptidyl-prolyl cis-trans isomerase [Patulibacter sp.]|nr:peptidyl-prolyl cis-trans isomerase [Patulibacter sp.]